LKRISEYCRSNNIKLHLDGARLHMASVWSGIPVREYAALFDTVYISLYKYLGAGSGAILSGDKSVIDKMPHLVKIHGGTQFSNWFNAAMAINRLEGLEERLQLSIRQANVIFEAVNKLKGIRVTPLTGGTNIYNVEFDSVESGKKIQEELNRTYRIRIPLIDSTRTQFTVNETILYRSTAYIIDAFTKAAGI
jgi:threonine aldolase